MVSSIFTCGMKLIKGIILLITASIGHNICYSQEGNVYETVLIDDMCEVEVLVQNAVQKDNYLFQKGQAHIYRFLDSLSITRSFKEELSVFVYLEIDSFGFLDSISIVRDFTSFGIIDSFKLIQFIAAQQPLNPAIYHDSLGELTHFEKRYLLKIGFCNPGITRMAILSKAIAGPGSRGQYDCQEPEEPLQFVKVDFDIESANYAVDFENGVDLTLYVNGQEIKPILHKTASKSQILRMRNTLE